MSRNLPQPANARKRQDSTKSDDAKQNSQQMDWKPAICNVEIDPPDATLTVKDNEGVITGLGKKRQIRIDHAPSSGHVVIEAVCSGYESSEQWYAPEAGRIVDIQIHLKKLPEATVDRIEQESQPEKPSTTYTQVDFSSQANYSWLPGYLPGAPKGIATLGGIPFNIVSNAAGNQGWSAQSAGDDPDGHKSITIPVNVYGVTDVCTLINTIYGQRGPNYYAWLTFTGSGGATYTKNLIGDIDIRDYCNGSLTNAINGITTVNVFRCPKTNNGTEGRLDMQHIVLPDEFADQTLKTIKLVDNGRWGLQRVVLDGVTVAVVPTPQSSAASASRQKINGNHSDHRRLTTLLKKKLHGRVAYNPKTGELVLTYDWASRQLDDFDLAKAEPVLMRGVLALRPGDSIRHVADFQEVKIAVPVLVPSMAGIIIRSSGGASARVAGANCDTMYLDDGRGELALIVPDSQRRGIQQILVTLERNHLKFTYGNGNNPSQLGKPVTDFHAGQVELFGGSVGFRYGPLTFAGTLDDDWVKKLLSPSKGNPIDKVVLWNEHNSHWNNDGTEVCNLALLREGKEVWRRNDLQISWIANQDTFLPVEVPHVVADTVRVEIVKWRDRLGGGLAEVQVFSDKRNIALGCPVKVSSTRPDGFPGDNLVDGLTTSAEHRKGYWCLPDGIAGWAEIDIGKAVGPGNGKQTK